MRSLGEVARLFLKLGVVGFGGPAAHIALMRVEVVDRRRWLDEQQFVDLVGVTGLIPGPSSTEMAIHVGRQRAGWPWLVVSGACFIAPAAAIVSALAWLYTEFGTTPRAALFLKGLEPVVLAIVAEAIWKLGRTAIRTFALGVVAVAAFVAVMLGVDPLLTFLVAGTGFAAARSAGVRAAVMLPFTPMVGAADITPTGIFLLFARIGFSVFGSGYVLLAYLQELLVEDLRLVSPTEVLDAVAIGQVTPGPVFTTATFLGFLIDGLPGAALATAGIFLPSFLLVAAIGPLIPRLRELPAVAAFIDGVNAVAIGVMATVLLQYGGAIRGDALALALAALAMIGLFVFRWSPTRVLIVGAAVGALRAVIG